MTDAITVPLTDKEAAVLSELAERMDLSPERVMILALRALQVAADARRDAHLGGPDGTLPYRKW